MEGLPTLWELHNLTSPFDISFSHEPDEAGLYVTRFALDAPRA
jgi:hypothetical protein